MLNTSNNLNATIQIWYLSDLIHSHVTKSIEIIYHFYYQTFHIKPSTWHEIKNNTNVSFNYKHSVMKYRYHYASINRDFDIEYSVNRILILTVNKVAVQGTSRHRSINISKVE